MRNVLILFFTLISAVAFAQAPTQKIGYADWEYIFSQMPEFKQIDNELKTHGAQLEAQMKAKYTEYQTKLDVYQKGAASMVEAIRRDKEAELTQLQENIQKFQQDAQASLQKKQSDLMAPVYSKVGKAIEEVAKAEGYDFILAPQMPGGGDVLLYSNEKFDISVSVLKKLGITPTASATTPK